MPKASLKIGLLTREYPPEIYGGAGVHVEFLARELARRVDLAVHCFGSARKRPEVAHSYLPWEVLTGSAPALAALRSVSVDLHMAAQLSECQLVHSHTWYTNLGGHFAKLLYGVPHVMTSHSLEPLRPWKAEQLGGGYELSCFCERTAIESADAVIAVSARMKQDILACYPAVEPERVHVIHNGIDPEQYKPDERGASVHGYGVDPSAPYVVFVGRITRQKGVEHVLNAARYFDAGIQLVLCAGEPDTKELGDEVRRLVAELDAEAGRVVWIERMLERGELIQLLSQARAFVCPSVYEPFGIVNLEAMACSLPVVASAVGGIPEVVRDGETGFLVPFAADAAGRPKDPDGFARALAERINQIVRQPELGRRFGERGRARVIEHFSWSAIADRTVDLYQTLALKKPGAPGGAAPGSRPVRAGGG